MKMKQIGNVNMDRENFKNPQCGRVYDSRGLSPTINTCGGNREPIIIDDTQGFENEPRVYGEVSPCLRSERSGLKTVVAMRGRNPDNPSDRTAGSPTEQRLEPNSQGICNTLTTVQKDNLLLESICINDRGFVDKEPQVSIGTVPTLRAETHGNLPKVIEKGSFCIGGLQEHQIERTDGISPTLTVAMGGGQTPLIPDFPYRIRKLIPLEVWRLMGFSDEDFHKAEEVNSNTQLYRQAGNSLVRIVMMAILSQLNIKGVKPWNEMSREERNDIQ